MNKFYIPLTNIKVDIARLTSEVLQCCNLTNNSSTSLTTSKKYTNDVNYDFSYYNGSSDFLPGSRTLKIYPDGELDHQISYWPTILENSYLRELGDYFANLFKVNSYRVRCSYLNNVSEDAEFKLHNDPHTPYRIHICLKTDPSIKWLFVDKDTTQHYIHQPADGIPVLIETGTTQHRIVCPQHVTRMHVWFQYYKFIDLKLLNTI